MTMMTQAERTKIERAVHRLRLKVDDVGLVAAAGLLIVLMLLGESHGILGVVRLLLGIGFVLFAPGYCIVAALYPRIGEIDTPTRLGLSTGLSVALVPLLTVLLDKLPWGIRPWPVLVIQLAVCALGLVVAVARRAQLAPGLQPEVLAGQVNWRLLLAWTCIACAMVIMVYGVTAPARAVPPTEFYALGPEGLAQGYPREVVVDADVTVTVGVASREAEKQAFWIEVWLVDRFNPGQRALLVTPLPVVLSPGEELRKDITWRHAAPGPDQLVEIQLRRDDSQEPYRRLQLLIDVLPS